ncbi:MAG: nucleotidyltransferase domain-containing protein [Synechococcus sp.]|nr:nucleotidyltransferase domain-containing protein [Synechococcus sp.]
MPSLAAIREQRRRGRRQPAGPRGVAGWPDVDLLAIAPNQQQADALADALLGARLGDDVLALSQERWQQLKGGDDPYWRAIGRDALRLDQP